ncbi:NUDIX domain-containing protein [Microbacterium sp. MPKO10]|uniref:NUDIX domain-containing protein n=1 Tax=Microbacterium sp. MPKO10 TaxID=2989818 RepID=UPI002235C58A|nr:NUDIX domain-containing protein [Microbacterium sp. MPKO10]MCW4459436.1 NUDIX domain-containing protein [Microbacterium sp. MPKO10]
MGDVTNPWRSSELRRHLADWTPNSAEQAYRRHEYLEFLTAHGDGALDRAAGSDHVTASCFIFSPSFRSILLCFHKKGRFWVQLGGHIEAGDATAAAAAARESYEESGLEHIRMLSDAPQDLNRHELAAAFGRCRRHWDLGFAALATGEPRASDESEDVAWWPVDALPENSPWDFRVRVANVLSEIRG